MIGGAVAVLAILGVVLGVTLGGGGGDKPEPPTPPVPPIPDDGFNPYSVDESTIVTENSRKSGVITIGSSSKLSSYYATFQRQANEARRAAHESANLTTNVATANLPTGVNNMVTSNVRFEFGQVDKSTMYMVLEDNDSQRWEPSYDVVGYRGNDPNQRLDMSNFDLQLNPFGFSIGSTYTDETLISTKGETVYLMDKYMQADFQLPSQRIYGLGERNREFALSQGTWTMWASGADKVYDDGQGGFKQGYGVHPFALV